MPGMEAHEAEAALDGVELIALMRGPIPYIRQLVQKCLDADIPAVAGHPPGEGGKG